jgi:hypothetical protein
VDLPQRLAALVLADGVELEARGPAQQQPATILGVSAALREEAVESDEARVDEQRRAGFEVELGSSEAEWVVDRRTRGLEDVTAARDPLEDVRAAI